MSIKKGIRLIAIGFVFTLINLNLKFNAQSINIMPDFIGWFIIAFAFSYMGSFKKGSGWLKWGSILLGLISAGLLVAEYVLPKYDLSLYKSGASILEALIIFFLLSYLEKIGRACGSNCTGDLKILKYVYLVVYIIFQALSLCVGFLPIDLYATLVSLCGVIALLTAIITALVLFRFAATLELEENEAS